MHVELYVVIEYGTNINTVSQNLVDQVTFALSEYVLAFRSTASRRTCRA